jgi:glycerol-3-phosphate acyltransferase PlsY
MSHFLNLINASPWRDVLFWTIFAYLLGSVRFSKLLTRWIAHADIREFGDGNPGAHNARLAGGWPLGTASVILDMAKGALPLLLAQPLSGLRGWLLLPVMLAPIIGHNFSIFDPSNRAKGVAPTLGAWIGLTGLAGLLSFGIAALIFMTLQTEDSWSVMAGCLGLCLYSIFLAGSLWMTAAAVSNLVLLAYSHRHNLQPIPWRQPVDDLFLRIRNAL